MGSANTRFSLAAGQWASVSVDGLIVPVYEETRQVKGKAKTEGKKTLAMPPALKALDKALRGAITDAAAEEKFDGGKGKTLVLRKSAGDTLKARRVVLMGLGNRDTVSVEDVEKNTLRALGALTRLEKCQTLALAMPEGCKQVSLVQATGAMVDAVHQATYRSAESKSKGPDVKNVSLLLSKTATAADKDALRCADIMARARSFGKDLVNKPSNTKTTTTLVEAAKTVGKATAITAKIMADTRWIEKNMPCFFEVARGSVATDPPKWITLTYKPKGVVKKKIALVGKSVIFDTGGYQVKTGNYMNTMKGDMTGGAMALATMRAIAELAPAGVEVKAYLAATPNKIDSHAMLPDSIVNTTCGKKVEIRHTDAEGRLTLIDAVAIAAREKPDAMVTIATLTGSASQAVGMAIALMGNNPDLEKRVLAAAEAHGEPIQPLRVIEDDYDNIKSKLDGADICNTSQRKNRGAQTAGAFVMSGAPEGIPMAHMDIAGADMTGDEKATGIAAKTLIQFVLDESASSGRGSGRTTKRKR